MKMSPKIRDLQIQAFAECKSFESGTTIRADAAFARFAELIVNECIDLHRREWYELNNTLPVENETLRDIGIRIGRKTEVNVLIEKIKKHFGVE